MPFFKCVFVYSQPIAKGFSEVYYREASSLQGAAQFDNATLNAACKSKIFLTVLRKIRVSDVAGNRSSVVIPVNRAGGSTGSTASAEVTGTSAVVLMSSTVTGARRNLWLRGLNDVDVLRDQYTGADTPSQALVQAINAWLRILANNNFCIRSLVQLGTPPNVFSKILSLSGTPGAGITTVNYQGIAVFVAGQRVILSQLNQKLYPGLNGHWSILSAAAGSFTVAYNLDTAPQTSEKTGRLRPETYQYGVIDSTVSRFDHFGTRTTGSGFTSGRGRKRAVHLRSL